MRRIKEIRHRIFLRNKGDTNKIKRTPEKCEKYQEFINQLSLMKVFCGTLGLWRTFHKLDEALKEVGFEVAEKIE